MDFIYDNYFDYSISNSITERKIPAALALSVFPSPSQKGRIFGLAERSVAIVEHSGGFPVVHERGSLVQVLLEKKFPLT